MSVTQIMYENWVTPPCSNYDSVKTSLPQSWTTRIHRCFLLAGQLAYIVLSATIATVYSSHTLQPCEVYFATNLPSTSAETDVGSRGTVDRTVLPQISINSSSLVIRFWNLVAS